MAELKMFRVEVMFFVDVTLDREKFTPEFFAEFNAHYYPFGESLEEHAQHLARNHVLENDSGGFMEGYGPLKEMGVAFNITGEEQLVVLPTEAF